MGWNGIDRDYEIDFVSILYLSLALSCPYFVRRNLSLAGLEPLTLNVRLILLEFLVTFDVTRFMFLIVSSSTIDKMFEIDILLRK